MKSNYRNIQLCFKAGAMGALAIGLNSPALSHEIKGYGACGITIKKAICTPKNKHKGDQDFCSIVNSEVNNSHCREHRRLFLEKFNRLKEDQSGSLSALQNYSGSLAGWEESLAAYPQSLDPYQTRWQQWSEKSAACKSGLKNQCGPEGAIVPNVATMQTGSCQNFDLIFRNWEKNIKDTDAASFRDSYPLFDEYKTAHQNASQVYNQNCRNYKTEVTKYLLLAKKHNASREQWLVDLEDWKQKYPEQGY